MINLEAITEPMPFAPDCGSYFRKNDPDRNVVEGYDYPHALEWDRSIWVGECNHCNADAHDGHGEYFELEGLPKVIVPKLIEHILLGEPHYIMIIHSGSCWHYFGRFGEKGEATCEICTNWLRRRLPSVFRMSFSMKQLSLPASSVTSPA